MKLDKLDDKIKDTVKEVTDTGKALENMAGKMQSLIRDTASGKITANTRAEMFKEICALVPTKIDNSTVVDVMDLLRKEQKVFKQKIADHVSSNEAAFKKHEMAIKRHKGYVEDQNAYTDMAYGVSLMQYSGCEIFATYNAMFNLLGKNPVSLSKMISAFENDGMLLSGKFGTAPKAIKDYLDKNGFKSQLVTDEKKFDALAKKSDSLILTMYNDKSDISKEVHTINISKENGKLTAHNVYCNGKVVGPYDSIAEVIKNINGGKAKGISLIGIKKK